MPPTSPGLLIASAALAVLNTIARPLAQESHVMKRDGQFVIEPAPRSPTVAASLRLGLTVHLDRDAVPSPERMIKNLEASDADH